MSRNSPNFASVNSNGQQPLMGAGRVNILSNEPIKLNLANYVTAPSNNCSYAREAISKQIQPTPLSDLFFSAMNIDALQDAIRYQTYLQTGQTIGRQSDAELKIVMRGTYLQSARNAPNSIIDQVRELNGLVLSYAVPEVVSNVKQYNKYLVDASTLPMPLERAPLATMKGSRALTYNSGL